MNNYLVWNIPLDRSNWWLSTQDILDSLSFFKEKTGRGAATILLHPLTQKHPPDIPGGVTAEYSFRVLAHEVFFPAPDKLLVPDPPKPIDPPPDRKQLFMQQGVNDNLPPAASPELCNIPKKRQKREPLPFNLIPVSKKGRPLKRGEVHRSTEWRRRRKAKQVVLV